MDEPVELARRLDQRRIAPRRDVIDDGAGGRLDISRDLPLGREKRLKARGKIGAAAIDADRHGDVSGKT